MANHLVVIGDSFSMAELKNNSVQLIVTSPPYFNVKNYGIENVGSIDSYFCYLKSLRQIFEECYRVLEDGRYICINVSDVISGKGKYNIPAHCMSILQRAGFKYIDDIIWKKPFGRRKGKCSGASKRFGVLVQHPYPMYYYPNVVYEHILVFRKGDFNFKKITKEQKKSSRVNLKHAKKHWSTNIWEMMPETRTNHPAMFPEILPKSLIQLYSFKGETVLDPFLGSGTTMKAAKVLERNSVGYEINEEYLEVIKQKTGFYSDPESFKIIIKRRCN